MARRSKIGSILNNLPNINAAKKLNKILPDVIIIDSKIVFFVLGNFIPLNLVPILVPRIICAAIRR